MMNNLAAIRWTFGAVLLGMALCAAACSGGAKKSVIQPPSKIEYFIVSTTAGAIVLELDGERAPISVANFTKYAESASYDGTIFHRVVPGFVIQGGGYEAPIAMTERAKIAAANGKPDVPIVNEWRNGLKNVRGTIAMARETDPDSATREFYINLADNAKLDVPREVAGGAGYAVFGRVIEGMDVVDRIAAGATKDLPDRDMKNVPIDPVVILAVRRDASRPAKSR